MGVFGSNFGHTVTQTLPVLAAQLAQGANQNVPAFNLAAGPPIFTFPAIPSNGLLPIAGPACYQNAYIDPVTGQNDQLCIQPHIRPTFQRLPELDAWNATVQQQISKSTAIDIAYVGNKGTHIFAGDGPTYNVNQPRVGAGADVAGAYVPNVALNARRPYYNAFSYPGFTDLSTGGTLMCCSTDQGNYLGNDASSIYNAFQVKLERRFSHGLQILSHYTFAHANKYDSNYYTDDPKVAYGPSDEVRNHLWVNNVVYELPFGRGKTFAGNSNRAEDLLVGGLADCRDHYLG